MSVVYLHGQKARSAIRCIKTIAPKKIATELKAARKHGAP